MVPSNPAPAASSVYTMREAARLKGVSYDTVSRRVRTGQLSARRIGQMAMIASADLDAWQPAVEKAPRKYRDRQPDPSVHPVLMDLVAGESPEMARRVSALEEAVNALSLGLAQLRADVTELRAAANDSCI